MNNERFLQPLVEHLLLYVGLDQTLAYVSTCNWHRKERIWLIEQHSIVDHKVAEQFAGSISIKYRSATVECVDQLETLPPTLTHLTFGYWFDQPLDNVTFPLTLTHLTFGNWFNQPLDNVTLPSTLTLSEQYNRSLDCLPSHVTVTRQ